MKTLEELQVIVSDKTGCNFTIVGQVACHVLFYCPFPGTEIIARFLYHGFAYSYNDYRYGHHRGGSGCLDTVENLTDMINIIMEDMEMRSERKKNKK